MKDNCNHWIILLVCMVSCSTICSFAKTTDTELIKKIKREIEESRKGEARKAKLAEEKEIKKQFTYTFNDVIDDLVIIEHELGYGSGFVVSMDGKRYILTNLHVILGANKVSFKTVSGEQLRPRKVELAGSRDMVRLLLENGAGLDVASTVETNALIAVFGNSEGAGVATELFGKVTDIGTDILEISADLVKGTSGSPVLNQDMKVIGLASYLRIPVKTSDTEEIQFENQARRFCTRLEGAKWRSVNWKKYNETYGEAFHEHQAFVMDVLSILSGIGSRDRPKFIVLRTGADHVLGEWVDKYNRSRKNFRYNMNNLADICRKRSGKIKRFISLQSNSEDYVRRELEGNMKMLESFAESLEQWAEK